MSFDIFLVPFEHGEAPAHDPELLPRLLAAARDAVQDDPRMSIAPGEKEGNWAILIDGCQEGSFSIAGASFFLHEVSTRVPDLIFALSAAGAMAIFPTAGPACVIITAECQREHLPSDVVADMPVQLCTSVQQLAQILGMGWQEHRAYVQRIVDDHSNRDATP